jgi:hypothetical protein
MLTFGEADPNDAVADFLVKAPNPDSTQVASFLQQFDPDERIAIAQALVAKGVSQSAVSSALAYLDARGSWIANARLIKGALTLAAASALAFHGYRRNAAKHPLAWSFGWFGVGLLFPVFSTVIALAQGFGKAK